jgi:uncharacterized membrane protein
MTLTVWLYDSAMGAAAGEVRLKDLQERGAVTIVDAVTITWVSGTHKPHVGHLRHAPRTSAARGSVLAAFVRSLLLAPAESGVGARITALSGTGRGSGIDETFLEQLKMNLSPGTSALLVLSSDADLDLVRPFVERGLARGDVRLMHAWLPDDASEALRRLVHDASAQGTWDDDGLTRCG